MLQDQGEETPLDHIPLHDESHEWFIDAFYTLTNSRNENGSIPLSELKIYAECFGLIGSFSEFVDVIYSLNQAHITSDRKKLESKKPKPDNTRGRR